MKKNLSISFFLLLFSITTLFAQNSREHKKINYKKKLNELEKKIEISNNNDEKLTSLLKEEKILNKKLRTRVTELTKVDNIYNNLLEDLDRLNKEKHSYFTTINNEYATVQKAYEDSKIEKKSRKNIRTSKKVSKKTSNK